MWTDDLTDCEEHESERVDDVDADAPATDGTDHLAQRSSSAAATADDRAKILRVNPDLKARSTAVINQTHPNIARVVHDALDQVLQRWPQRAVSPAARRRPQQPSPLQR